MLIKLPECKLEEERFWDGNKAWVMAKVVEAAKDLPVFDLPLAHIDISVEPWSGSNTVQNLAYHVKRAEMSDLKYPIILNDSGYIMNGWHRILKALVEGRESIKAVRFEVTPPHCFSEDD